MADRPFGATSGALIVAGTSVGAGMLGLPVVTGGAGFFPSLVILVASWAFMTATGLMFIELLLWEKSDANLLRLAYRTMGNNGRRFVWGWYLFLFYSLTVAYVVGGGNMIADSVGSSLPLSSCVTIFCLVFIAIIAAGRHWVAGVNRWLMAALLLSYIGFLAIGAHLVQGQHLMRMDWAKAAFGLPIAFTSFGFQGTLPTLARWVHYDAVILRKSVVRGTLIALAIYIVWQWLVLGIVPEEGTHGLAATLAEGRDAVHPLQYFTQHPFLCAVARLFAFAALATSFLGVGVGLVDFLADGLKRDVRKAQDRALLLVVAFLPPILAAFIYPDIFLAALGVAGGFGCAVLLGVLPITMVVAAKMQQGAPLFQDAYSWLGRKRVLDVLLLFVAFEMLCELINLMEYMR